MEKPCKNYNTITLLEKSWQIKIEKKKLKKKKIQNLKKRKILQNKKNL